MSCNCPDTNKCPDTTINCLCGVTFNIYNSEGVLVETVDADTFMGDSGIYYQISGSTAFAPVIGPGYVLTISYNSILERWEMSYYNQDLDLNILLGVLYGLTNSECPISNCWDLDCNAVGFNVLGIFTNYFSWNGGYVNDKKYYSFSSNWSGPFINYSLSWGLAPAPAGAPEGTYCWTLYDEDSDSYAGYLFSLNKCPYGVYLTGWDQAPTRFSFTDLGVTGYDVKTSAIDCGCCDTEVIITIDGEEYTASVEYDEYGNILGYNGITYYTFTVDGNIYYLFYLNNQWVVKQELSEFAEIIFSLNSINECPYGYYINNALCNCLTVRINQESGSVAYTANKVGTYDGYNVYSFNLDETTIYIWFSAGDGWVMTLNGYGGVEWPEAAFSTYDGACPDSINELFVWISVLILGDITTEKCSVIPVFNFLSVKGIECFDCCDYYAPRNRNLLKKKKAIFVEEISAIRNQEIFGLKCGGSWDDLFRKHLIFDVLNCLPYGVLCEEEEQCLINNLNENCNC